MQSISSLLIALVLAVASPAIAGTQVGVIYDNTTKDVVMVVVPDHDAELDDAAYNKQGFTQLRIPLSQFKSSTPDSLQKMVPGWVPPPPRLPNPIVLKDATP